MSNIAPYEAPRILPEATLPAGTYLIGDPCYTIDNDDWDDWLNAADFRVTDNRHVLAAHVNGRLAVGVNTAYGDGTYYDQHGFEYGVDAGLIGAVPVETAKAAPWNAYVTSQQPKESDGSILGLARVWTFHTDVTVWYDAGVIHIGELRIDTTEEF